MSNLRVLWYCPFCDRNDIKSRTGVILHVQRKHPDRQLPPWWQPRSAVIEGRA